ERRQPVLQPSAGRWNGPGHLRGSGAGGVVAGPRRNVAHHLADLEPARAPEPDGGARSDRGGGRWRGDRAGADRRWGYGRADGGDGPEPEERRLQVRAEGARPARPGPERRRG